MEAVPVVASFLASSVEPFEQELFHTVFEFAQAYVVVSDTVVMEITNKT